MKNKKQPNEIAINEPSTEEQHWEADREHTQLAARQKEYLDAIVSKLERGEPLTGFEAKFAAAVLRKTEISGVRKRAKGGKKIPDEALLLRQAYIKGGMSPTEADNTLAAMYSVDTETFKRQMNRLRKRINPADWGLPD